MQTVANKVTFVRIIFAPLFVGLLVSSLPHKAWLAATVFAVIAATDGLDGYLARTFNQVTDLGKILDPLADKIVISAALIALIKVSYLPAWVAVVLIVRELLILGLRYVALKKDVIISASNWGKYKTFFQIMAIFFWIFNTQKVVFINSISWILIGIALFFSLISAIQYLIRFKGIWTIK